MQELRLDENIELYRNYFKKAKYKTVYHDPDYLLAEQFAEDYPIFLYLHEIDDDFVILPSVKRRLNDLAFFKDIDEELYDLKTPHEYSGVIASLNKENIISSFYKEFFIFCKMNNIIFSFIRFNPFRNEHMLAGRFSVIKSGEQVWIDTDKDDIWENCKYSFRRKIRYAQKDELIYLNSEASTAEAGVFAELYYDSMSSLNAKPFFNFNDQYFEKLLNTTFSKLHFVNDKRGKVIASAITLYDEDNHIGYYHLGCRNRSDVSERGSYELLISKFSEYLKEKGAIKVHLGGAPNESLLQFKRRFSDKRIDYYIGYAIFNIDKYNVLCEKFLNCYPEEKTNNFKPLYRCKE